MDRLRGVQLVLGAALLGLAVQLVAGEKPGEGEAAELLRQGKPVYFLDRARKRLPGLMSVAEDAERFEKIAEFHGFEPRGHMLMYRYRGRAVPGHP